MHNKIIFAILIGLGVFAVWYLSRHVKSRGDKIAYITGVFGYNDKLTQYTDKEIDDLYIYSKLSEQGVKPDDMAPGLRNSVETMKTKYA